MRDVLSTVSLRRCWAYSQQLFQWEEDVWLRRFSSVTKLFCNWRRPLQSKWLTLTEIVAVSKLNLTLVPYTYIYHRTSLYEIVYLGTVSLIHCPLTLEVGNYAVILHTCVQPIYKHVVTISATATLLYMVGVSGPAVIMAYKSIHPWVLRHNALCTVSTTI